MQVIWPRAQWRRKDLTSAQVPPNRVPPPAPTPLPACTRAPCTAAAHTEPGRRRDSADSSPRLQALSRLGGRPGHFDITRRPRGDARSAKPRSCGASADSRAAPPLELPGLRAKASPPAHPAPRPGGGPVLLALPRWSWSPQSMASLLPLPP